MFRDSFFVIKMDLINFQLGRQSLNDPILLALDRNFRVEILAGSGQPKSEPIMNPV